MGRSAEPRDLTEWEGLNTDFHQALVGAAGSVWLLRMRGMMYQHHERYRQLSRSQPANLRDVHEEHRALFESAMDRDVPRATEVIRAHIQRTTDAVSRALESGAHRA